MSLPSIQNVWSPYYHLPPWFMIFIFLAHYEQSWPSSFDPWYFTLSYLELRLTFLEAVIIILKHATFLRLSKLSRESALRKADLHYQQANVDLNIQEHLTTACQEQSVKQFIEFIMASNLGLFNLTYVKQISYLHLELLVPSQL